MSSTPTDEPLSAEPLRVLRDKGMISSEAYWKGMRQLVPRRDWLHWASVFCLILGASLVLAGVVFFFAYNWEGLHRWAKFGLLQGVGLSALVASQVVGLKRLSGQLCLLGASMLIGVCFAVYGQVYQTGADAFSYFAMWAICISPWVMAARFAPLWILWLILINLTCLFFWNQVGRFHQTLAFPYMTLVLSGVNGMALFLCVTCGRHRLWLQASWLCPLLLLGLLSPLTAPVLGWIFEFGDRDLPLSFPLGALVWGLVLGGLFVYYNFKQFEPTALSFVLVDAAIVLLFLIARLLIEEARADPIGIFFLMAITTIGLSAGLLVFVRKRIAAHVLNERGEA